MFSNLRRGENGWIVDGVDGVPWRLANVSGKNACGLYRLGGDPGGYAQLYIYDGDLNQNRMIKELRNRNMWIDTTEG